MITRVATGEAVVCEEHEIAQAIAPWLTEEDRDDELAEKLQFAVMRRENTRTREYYLGVAIWR
ncbi:hypothetical protein [Isoptericola sp. QY 916]|uniref:hypothetical protein n=1 Tax=Isoptericola sp. QY 916 TaxID=2782570 RepID=UPI003D2FAC64|nr:hypothetical protein [Isoptericola sp. QY 916]